MDKQLLNDEMREIGSYHSGNVHTKTRQKKYLYSVVQPKCQGELEIKTILDSILFTLENIRGIFHFCKVRIKLPSDIGLQKKQENE